MFLGHLPYMGASSMSNEEIVKKIKDNIDVNDNLAILWGNNKRFIYQIASKYAGMAEHDDLMQEGYMGLCNAVYKYDIDSGVKFLTYAEYWIKNYMQRFITQKNTSIRVPDGRRQQIRQYLKAVSEYEKYMGRKPNNRELASILGVGMDELEQIEKDAKCINVSSLDVPIDSDDDITMEQILPGCDGIEDEILDNQNENDLKSVLWSMVDNLPSIQPEVIKMVYSDGMKRKDVAESIGSTEKDVRREESKALISLRHPRNASRLKMYMPDYVPGRFSNVSIRQFNNTWTSQVERDAFKKCF